MFRGLANLNLVAEDLPAAIDWYTRVFDSAGRTGGAFS